MVCLADRAKISRLSTSTTWRRSCRSTLSRFAALALVAISVEASRDEQESARDRNFHLEKVSSSSQSAPYEGVGASVREKLNQAADGLQEKAEAQARVTGDVSHHIEQYQNSVKNIGMSVKRVQQAQRELSTAYQQDVEAAEPDRVRPLDLEGELSRILQDQGDELKLNRGWFHGGQNSSSVGSSFEESEDIPRLVVGGRGGGHNYPDTGDGLQISSNGHNPEASPRVHRDDLPTDINEDDEHELDRLFDNLVKEKFGGEPTETINGEPPPPLRLHYDPDRPENVAKVDEAVLEWERRHPDNPGIPLEWKKKHGYPQDDSYLDHVQHGGVVGSEVNPGMMDSGLIHHDGKNEDDEEDDDNHGGFSELSTMPLDNWKGKEDPLVGNMRNEHKALAEKQLHGGSLVQVEDEADVPPVADDDADTSEEKEYAPQEYTPRRNRHASRGRPNPWKLALAPHKRRRHRWGPGIDNDMEGQQIRRQSHRPQDRDEFAYQRLPRQNHRRHQTAMELQPRSFRYERGYRPTPQSDRDDLDPSDLERYDLGRHRHSIVSEYRPRHHARRYD